MNKSLLLFLLMLIIPLAASAEDESPDTIVLDDIVISATRSPASISNVSASSSVITEKQINSSSATSLSQLLDNTNIVQILSYGSGSLSSASLRGSTSSQVLVLVDGERINDSRSGMADLDGLPVTYANRIEVIRGGQSALYGADAVGGIINIITKQPKKASAKIWSSLESYNTRSLNIEASKQLKPLSALISFSRADSESDFPFKDKYGRTLKRENADYMKRNAFGKLAWNIADSANLRLSAIHSYSDSGSPGMIGLYTPYATKIERSNIIKADLEHQIADGTSYKIYTSRRNSVLRYIDAQVPSDDTHKTDTTNAEFQTYLLQNTTMPLIFGGLLRDEHVTSNVVGARDRETYSLYAQQEFAKSLDTIRMAIFPALRWDHYSDFESGLSPKIGFLVTFPKLFHKQGRTAVRPYKQKTGGNELISIRSNIGRSYRAPTMNDLYWPSDPMTSGNPNLKPESSEDMDIGVGFHSRMLRINATYFYSRLHEGIKWTPDQYGKWMPINISEVNAQGLEAETQISFLNELLSFRANYTFVQAEDRLKRQMINQPRHALGYSIRVGTERLWLQAMALYNSRRYYTPENTKWLEPFIKHDVQLGTERKLGSYATAGLVIEIRNVFDAEYQLITDYPLPGREWRIKMSIGTM